ncbi:IS3 family transposase [Clostridium sp. D43t1_170807_H7]|uniref:IS3 family transposase n=1 Tax=Clostridium sp. D43t1_170807_H7 TaxID=2787140 RepID=UPI00189A4A81|nr:IS3 family transposase [Clostridium sp. D43t1_170807_H7]
MGRISKILPEVKIKVVEDYLDGKISLYSEVKGIYGYRRISLNINNRLNSNYNHKRIYRLMKSVKLTSVMGRNLEI